MTKYFSPSLVAVAAFAGLAAGSPLPQSLPASANLSPANSPAIDTSAARFLGPEAAITPDGNPDQINQPSFSYEANFGRRGLGLLGLGGDVNQNVNELGGGIGGVPTGDLPTGDLPVAGGAGLSPNSLPPVLTAALDTADTSPNTADIKLNLCRLLGINCPKIPLTSTNVPKIKGGVKGHVSGSTKGKGKGKTKGKPKGKGYKGKGAKGSGGSKFSGGKNQINNKNHADGGNGSGGNGGTANGGSASCGPGGSLIGLTALNFNSCNGGNGGAANGGAGTGGRGGDTSSNLGRRLFGHDAPAAAPVVPAAAKAPIPAAAGAPSDQAAGVPSAQTPAGVPAPAAPAANVAQPQSDSTGHHVVAAVVNHERDAELDAADSAVQAFAERGAEILAQKKEDESMASFVARTLASFRAQSPSPARVAARAFEALAVAGGDRVPATQSHVQQARLVQLENADAAVGVATERDLTVGQIMDTAANKQPVAASGAPAAAAAPAAPAPATQGQTPSAAQVPAQAQVPANNPVPADSVKAFKASAPKSAKVIASKTHRSRDITIAELINDASNQASSEAAQAAPQTAQIQQSRDITLAELTDDASNEAVAEAAQAPQARLVNLEGSEADLNAGPESAAQARDFTVASIENESVPTAPLSRRNVDVDVDVKAVPDPEARAKVSVLHSTENNEGHVSSARSLALNGDQDGNTLSTSIDNKGAKFQANGSTPSSSDGGTTDDSQDSDSSDATAPGEDDETAVEDGSSDEATDPTAGPTKRGNNKAGVSTGYNRQGRVTVATAGNGGDAISGNGGDASGFAFDNSGSGGGFVPLRRPLRLTKAKSGSKKGSKKSSGKGSARHHFKVTKSRQSTSGGKASSSGKLSSHVTSTSPTSGSNPIIEIDLALLRQLIGQDRLEQLAGSEKSANDALVAAAPASKKYTVSRPSVGIVGSGSGSGSGAAHIQGSGNGGDASSGAAYAGNGGNVNISQR